MKRKPETWKPVPSHPEFLASTYGRTARIAQIVLPGSHGYKAITMTAPGKKPRVCLVHRMIAEAFHGPCPSENHEVRHLNGDRLDNRPENLCWGTRSENQMDRVVHSTSNRGSRHGMSKLTEDEVRSIRERYAMGHQREEIARAYDVDPGTIAGIVKRKTWAWLN